MVSVAEMEGLFDGLCGPVGVYFAVRSISLPNEDIQLDRDVRQYLTGAERNWYDALRSKKRKSEFCAGRIAAKLAIRKFRPDLQISEINVLRSESGAPIVTDIDEIHLSITHCARFAIAVTAPFFVGVDLEVNEPRPKALIKYFMNEAESVHILGKDPYLQDYETNCLWTRKEAVSKVGRWGGSLDFKTIDCTSTNTTVCGRTIELVTKSCDGFIATLAYEKSLSNAPNDSV
jgi:4'-phosphopantetheinyl transferase EntD